MQVTIGEIAEQVPIVAPSTKCEDVYSLFNENSSLEGIVVCSNHKPDGLVMKTQFYQKLSTKYGFDLFMRRTIDLIMNPLPLIVNDSMSITEVSSLAMQRAQESLYDYVIVTKENQLFGIVSIKNLLMKLAEVQVRTARYANPLTGLPGNYEIIDALKEVLKKEKYAVLYIDINSFKVFNDTYGFKIGDEIIQEVATIISETILPESSRNSFVGHIGGDDFIAVLPHYQYEEICSCIIDRLDKITRKYYSDEILSQGYTCSISRNGTIEKVPLIGLSIAVIHNRMHSFHTIEELSKMAAILKKKCKEVRSSIFLALDDMNEDLFESL